MPDRRHRGRQLRDVFITLALIFLVGAGAAYGVTRYLQSELESDANRDARKLSVDVLQPLLIPADAQGPVQGARYDELLAAVDQRVLAGPINGVLLLAQDGTVLFADRPSLVGDHEPALRDDIHAVIAGTSQSSVDGDRFRTLTARSSSGRIRRSSRSPGRSGTRGSRERSPPPSCASASRS
jgi:hypothetical protein